MAARFDTPHPPQLPPLTILSPDEVRRTEREKYGALLQLGRVGLILLITLVGWFLWSAWSLRTVWSRVYVLHDASRAEEERVRAASLLARDPLVTQRQLWDIALRRDLPPLARYLVAEGLTASAVADDPRGYATAVARSEGWPDWLRYLLARPMVYRAVQGLDVPRAPLEELASVGDPLLALWARAALGASASRTDEPAVVDLRAATRTPAPEGELAAVLLEALEATRLPQRFSALDRATSWMRRNHPAAKDIWHGWVERDGQPLRETP